jgi:hypothetical protein
MVRISSVAAQLAASEEGFSSMRECENATTETHTSISS